MTRSTVSWSGGSGGAGGGGSHSGRPMATASRSALTGVAARSAISRNVPAIPPRPFSSRIIATSDGLHLQRHQYLHVTSIIAPGVKTPAVLVFSHQAGGEGPLHLCQGELLVLDLSLEDLALHQEVD